MSALRVSASPTGFLHRETDPASSLTKLLTFLRSIVEDDAPSWLASEETALRPRPSIRQVDALRLWPEGIRAVLAADDAYLRLRDFRSTQTARAAFVSLAPVLVGWHADILAADGETPGGEWLDSLNWPHVLASAHLRDAAARAVIAGRAAFQGCDIVMVPGGAA